MPDFRVHRGPHPDDQQLFVADNVPRLQEATRDLSWLLSRGYASPSALKIVGDRYLLDRRQRVAVARCACDDAAKDRRRKHQVTAADLVGQELWIDGYNVLTSVESAIAGGIILHARDGCYRDMASMHGTYRSVAETIPAIQTVGESIASWHVARCHWLLDQPVSNSGRLKASIRTIAEEHNWNYAVELFPAPDRVLCSCEHIVASADSQIIDRAERWYNLARAIIDSCVPGAWIIDLSAC